MLNQKNKYAPDVLDCIANLSNDEVFTSPKLANQMLDMVPQELFTNPRAKFLDPCCKSGVFLREIVKRLDKGLADIIPDRQARIDHILHKQVFGIAITELTAQLSRRTVYCSKYACAMQSGDIWISDENDNEHGIHETHSYSISEFTADDVNDFCINPIQGNIRFNKSVKHEFDKNGVCEICGANKKSFDEDRHAYELIHINETRLEALKSMQWDLIIGNPPYQLNTNEQNAQAKPIYNVFIEQAKKLQPRYLAMIIPSRWMFGGLGLDTFRDMMLDDKHITILHDYINSKDCFQGVDIKGGVCYFLRERDTTARCKVITHTSEGTITSERFLREKGLDVFVRQSELIEIKNKVWADKKQKSISEIISGTAPYGLTTDFFAPTKKDESGVVVPTTVEEKYNIPTPKDEPVEDGYEIVGLLKSKRTWKYVEKGYPFPKNNGLGKYKVFLPKAYGCGAVGEVPSTPVLGTPVLGTPVQACTMTFIEYGPWDTKEESVNALKYLKTKFFRCLVAIKKQSQDATSIKYKYVPMQDFTEKSDIDWSKSIAEIDKQLYKKYSLSQEDINFIETNITPMYDEVANTEDLKSDDTED